NMSSARPNPLNHEKYDGPEIPSKDGPLAVFTAAISAARKHWLRLCTWIVVCCAAAAIYANSIPLSYTSTGTLLLEPKREGSGTGRDVTAMPQLDVARVNLNRALGFLKKPIAPSDQAQQVAFTNFVDRVGVRRVGQSYVVEVSYSSYDPTLARRVTNATLSAYLWQSVASKADAARNGGEFIQGRVNALAGQADAAAAAILNGSLPMSPTPDADARVIGAALQPLRPSAPRTGLIIALGGMLGVLSGASFVAFRAAIDRRIWTIDDLSSSSGLACFAVIPEVKRRPGTVRRSIEEICELATSPFNKDFSSAIGDLRTSLILSFNGQFFLENRSVAFISWDSGAGSTTMSLSLAAVMDQSGYKITLIDGDLDRKSGGLTSIAQLAKYSLADILSGANVDQSSVLSTIDKIDLIAAKTSDGPEINRAYLGSPLLTKFISHLRLKSNVLLDLPALSRCGDARAAAVQADCVVLVVSSGRTSREDVASALRVLNEAGANVIGAVLNRV
ncbi:lipopolysaccharide biosynthesis protein, partial [Methylobacterium sp. WL7]|uniref:nucleotide-binding protein n=1 Tax=Methylobacterium sp. WL7 TaxID=2603900 RepID=UPI0011CAE5B5